MDAPQPTPPSAPARRGRPEPVDAGALEALLERMYAEDLGWPESAWGDLSGGVPADWLECDLTTASGVPAEARAEALLRAKADGVLAGLEVFARAFTKLDPSIECELRAADGHRIAPGQIVARLEGPARALLVAERTALNLVQRMSGVATLTRAFVDAVEGTDARVLDTRKTTPGLRFLERYAVRVGGGENHRYGLFDEVLIKDNHADLAGLDDSSERAATLVAAARERFAERVRVVCEARDGVAARGALRAGADVLLLDNFEPAELGRLIPELRALAAELGRRVELEASGGLNLDTVGDYARCGVDRLSIGALTHSAKALDLSLALQPLGVGARR
ncbi:MAG: carboxylating nicotinate-nucleotide diphosphorylase [Planctomycetota bacterium]